MRQSFEKWGTYVYYVGLALSLALSWWSYINFRSSFEQAQALFNRRAEAVQADQQSQAFLANAALLSAAIAANDLASAERVALKLTDQVRAARADEAGVLPVLNQIRDRLQNREHPGPLLASFAQKLQSVAAQSLGRGQEELGEQSEAVAGWVKRQSATQESLRASFLLISILLTAVTLMQAHLSRVRRELAESSKLSAFLFDSLDEAVLLVLPDGTIAESNLGASRLFRRAKRFMNGAKIQDILPQILQRDQSPFQRRRHPLLSLASVQRPHVNFVFGIREGETVRWLSLNTQPLAVDLSGARSILFTLREITQTIEQQEQLEAQRAQLAQSAKMSALGEMAAGIAHEINNPLAIIKLEADNILDMAEEEAGATKAIEESSALISKTVIRIADIIKGLKTFSRNKGSDEPLVSEELATIVKDTQLLCQAKFKQRQIGLEFEIPTDLKVRCRPVQTVQVLLNLLNNAADAVSEGANPWVRVRAIATEGVARIEVIDSGKGISPELVTRIFQPFFTTKEIGSGTGLGLSISLGIMQSQGGRLYVDSNQPNTCFVMELALA